MIANLQQNFDAYMQLKSEEGRKSMEAIQKSINPNFAGFMNPSTQGTAGDFWAITPEDLDGALTLLDYQSHHLAISQWVPKGEAKQTVVQYPRLLSHGDPWAEAATSEGAVAVQDKSIFTRGAPQQASVKVKQYSQMRSITDILAHTTIGDYAKVAREPLQLTTNEAMLALMRQQERDIFFGLGIAGSNTAAALPSLAPEALQLEGIVPQLQKAGSVFNLDGSQLTMEALEDFVRNLQSAPFYGMPTDIMVTPKVFTSLSRQQVAMARRQADGKGIVYGFDDNGLQIVVGTSKLTIKPYVFLDDRAIPPPTTDIADTAITAPAGAAYANQNAKMQVASSATSKFGALDAGFYAYGVSSHGVNGVRIKTTIVPNSGSQNGAQGDSFIQVAAGQKVSFSISADGNNATKYYRLFRTPVFATAAALKAALGMAADGDSPTAAGWKKFQYLASFTAQDSNAAAAAVAVVDENIERTDTGKCLILRQDPTSIQLYDLIPLMRLPLARVNASQPFMLLRAMGLAVKAPEQMMLIQNCAPPSV